MERAFNVLVVGRVVDEEAFTVSPAVPMAVAYLQPLWPPGL